MLVLKANVILSDLAWVVCGEGHCAIAIAPLAGPVGLPELQKLGCLGHCARGLLSLWKLITSY